MRHLSALLALVVAITCVAPAPALAAPQAATTLPDDPALPDDPTPAGVAPDVASDVEPDVAPDVAPDAGPDVASSADTPPPRGLVVRTGDYLFREYPRRVGLIAIHTFTGRSLLVLAVGGVSVPLLREFADGPLREQDARTRTSEPLVVKVSEVAGAPAVAVLGSAFTAASGALAGSDLVAGTGTLLLEALPVAGAYTELLKRTVGRERPDRSDHLSFPSGHSSITFTVATIVAGRHGWLVGVPIVAAAAIVAGSRVEADRHFFSDTVFGATLGTAVGLSALSVRRTEERRAVENGTSGASRLRLGVVPFTLPGGGGLALVGEW